MSAWSLHEEPDRTNYISKLPPIPLALRLTLTALSSYVSEWKNVFSFDLKWSSTSSQNGVPAFSRLNIQNELKKNIKGSLTQEQYKNLLNHINNYMESIITSKLSATEQTVPTDMSIKIAAIVKENINNYKYSLTDDDINKIASLVQAEIKTFNTNLPLTISKENLKEIVETVKTNIQDDLQHLSSKINADEVLQILSSSKLFNILDQRIIDNIESDRKKIEEQQNILNLYQQEISSLQQNIINNVNMNRDLTHLFKELQQRQEHLENQLNTLVKENEIKHNRILQDIELNISEMGIKYFSGIDDQVKLILIDVFGLKTSDGKPMNSADIQNVLQNMFVAKSMLEIRLEELNAKFKNELRDEINLSSGIIMNNIGQKIKEETLALLEKNNENLAADLDAKINIPNFQGNLDEQEIRRIVKAALDVYDADKTGLVDYALESAGGEIISTR